MSLEEYAATQPLAPCGNQTDHYYWALRGWPCSVCAAQKKAERQRKKDRAMANMIAEKLNELMKERKPCQDCSPWLDHQTRQIVDELYGISVKYHATQQLRDRIAHVIHPMTAALQAAQNHKGTQDAN